MKNFINHFLCVVLGIIVATCIAYKVLVWNTVIDPEIKFNSEIETLQTVQDQWVKQAELLIIVDRLSFSLQCAELDKKELFHSLDKAVKENIELKQLVNHLIELLEGSTPNTGTFNPDDNHPTT